MRVDWCVSSWFRIKIQEYSTHSLKTLEMVPDGRQL